MCYTVERSSLLRVSRRRHYCLCSQHNLLYVDPWEWLTTTVFNFRWTNSFVVDINVTQRHVRPLPLHSMSIIQFRNLASNFAHSYISRIRLTLIRQAKPLQRIFAYIYLDFRHNVFSSYCAIGRNGWVNTTRVSHLRCMRTYCRCYGLRIAGFHRQLTMTAFC
jgi:hypothetical protein